MLMTATGQSNSPDLVSVSQYYSSELVAYVRKVRSLADARCVSVFNFGGGNALARSMWCAHSIVP